MNQEHRVTIDIPEVAELRETAAALKAAVDQLVNAGALTKEWYTARECCHLKGVPYNTLRLPAFVHLLPNFGRPTAVLESGRCRHMYHRSDVAMWLPLTQADIERERERRKAI